MQLDLFARAKKLDKAITYDSLEKGMVLTARVTDVGKRQVRVQLMTTPLASLGVCILDGDRTKKLVALSTCPLVPLQMLRS